MVKRALLSVSDKKGLVDLAWELTDMGVELISTGGTARVLREAGLVVRSVEEVTGFPEILGGRVKTLHPAIHGGLLAKREEDHLRELTAREIAPLDLIAVNLYPFQETIARPDTTLSEALEQIDIGGVTLLRAGAKNFAAVVVLSDPSDYVPVVEELKTKGDVSLETRQRLALKAFQHTAEYDGAISRYLASLFGAEGIFPYGLQLGAMKWKDLRYGENPHQEAALYNVGKVWGPLGGTLLQGEELSYNNLLDLDAAWRTVQDFAVPTIAIIKHNNPCGLASAQNLVAALPLALASDPVSAFGSIVAANRPFDGATAQALGDLFVEAIVASGFTEEARKVLATRPRCRLLEITGDGGEPLPWEVKSVRGGLLLQERDIIFEDEGRWKAVTKRKPAKEEMKSLAFAWRAVKHVKSNAIVLVQGTATVGIGAGQMSRLDATELAIRKAGPQRCKGAVLASDAFFPFPDGVEAAAQAGVTAIIQPGGSIRDQAVIAAADAGGLAMVFTGVRHFRH